MRTQSVVNGLDEDAESWTLDIDVTGGDGSDSPICEARAERWGWEGRFGIRASREAVSDPVQTTTGNFIEQRLDLGLPASVAGFSMERTYNSHDASHSLTAPPVYPSLLGPGWSTPFDASLEELEDDDVGLRLPDGRLAVFESDGQGGWDAPEEVFGTLDPDADGYRIDWFDGGAWDFNGSGQIVQVVDFRGEVMDIAYANGLPSTAVAGADTFTFAYDATHTSQLKDVTHTRTGVSGDRKVQYTYAADGTLNTVTDAGGVVTTYVTGANGAHDDLLITEVKDGDNRVLLKNAYLDPDVVTTALYGQVDYQDLPCQSCAASGGSPAGWRRTAFTYHASGDTDITDLRANETLTYSHDAGGRVIAIEDSQTPQTEFQYRAYDADGNLTQILDRGHLDPNNPGSDSDNTVSQTIDPDTGLLTSYTALDQSVTTFEYDSLNRLTKTIRNPGANQRVTEYKFNAGNDGPIPDEIIDPAGKTTAVTHSNGRIDTLTDADGVETQNFWNPTTGDLDKVVLDPGGLDLETEYTYDLSGQVKTITSPADRVATMTYDGAGRLLTRQEHNEGQTVYEYFPDGNLKKVTEPEGLVTEYTYDPATGEIKTEKVTDDLAPGGAASFTTSYDYDPTGMLDTVTRPGIADGATAGAGDTPDQVTTYEYGALARLEQTDLALNSGNQVTEYGYDEDGNQTEHKIFPTGPTGQALTTTTSFDPLGRVEATTNPATFGPVTEYNAFGQTKKVTEAVDANTANDIVTEYTYDTAGRPEDTKVDNEVITRATYTDAGRPLRTTTNPDSVSGGGNTFVVEYGYDDAGRQNTVTLDPDDLNFTTTTAFDADGRPTSVTDPEGRQTSTEYQENTLNEHTVVVSPPGTGVGPGQLAPTTRVTNTRGQILRETTPTSPTATVFEYDERGNVIKVTDPEGGIVEYTYDARNNRRTRTSYPDGTTPVVEEWEYDEADQLVAYEDGLDRRTTYDYDQAGRQEQINHPGGRTESFDYGEDGYIDQIDYVDGGSSATDTFDHDRAGRRILGDGDLHPATVYGYDKRGNITSINDGDAQAFTWDFAGNRTTVTAPKGGVPVTTTYTYDDAGRVTTVSNPDLGDTTYVYDDAGLLERENLPDGQYREWTRHDLTGLVTRYRQVIDGTDTTTHITYRPDGRINTETTDGVTTAYTYDDAGQLTSVRNGDPATGDDLHWTYDDVGNRLTETVGHPGLPGLIPANVITQRSYTYDDANQLTGASTTAGTKGETWTYMYNSEGQLTDAHQTAGGTDRTQITYAPNGTPEDLTHTTPDGVEDLTLRHDHDGRLVRVTANPGATRETTIDWDTTTPVPQPAGIDGNIPEEAAYIYGPARTYRHRRPDRPRHPRSPRRPRQRHPNPQQPRRPRSPRLRPPRQPHRARHQTRKRPRPPRLPRRAHHRPPHPPTKPQPPEPDRSLHDPPTHSTASTAPRPPPTPTTTATTIRSTCQTLWGSARRRTTHLKAIAAPPTTRGRSVGSRELDIFKRVEVAGFIPDKESHLLPGAFGLYEGDGRSFALGAIPRDRTRFFVEIDFPTGVAKIRVNPTHSVDGNCWSAWRISVNQFDTGIPFADQTVNMFSFGLDEDRALNLKWSVVHGDRRWFAAAHRVAFDGSLTFRNEGSSQSVFYSGDCFPSVEAYRFSENGTIDSLTQFRSKGPIFGIEYFPDCHLKTSGSLDPGGTAIGQGSGPAASVTWRSWCSCQCPYSSSRSGGW